MTIVLGAVAAAAVFAIAAVVVGREARRLAAQPARKVFDLDDAVSWVCLHVGDEVAAVLSPGDVRLILDWHLDYLRQRGVSSNGSGAPAQEGSIVVGGAETVAYVLERAEGAGSPYTPEQVHAVLDAQMTYLESIGAVGVVPEPGDGQEKS